MCTWSSIRFGCNQEASYMMPPRRRALIVQRKTCYQRKGLARRNLEYQEHCTSVARLKRMWMPSPHVVLVLIWIRTAVDMKLNRMHCDRCCLDVEQTTPPGAGGRMAQVAVCRGWAWSICAQYCLLVILNDSSTRCTWTQRNRKACRE